MDTLQTFLAYAADFEKTYVDDNWSRLTPYFADDAVYRVESDLMGCELIGPSAILAGMKKALDGFDRRLETRTIDVTAGPAIDGDEMTVSWTVTYTHGTLAPFGLRGESLARARDGKIVLLVDRYTPEMDDESRVWMRDSGLGLDPSYV